LSLQVPLSDFLLQLVHMWLMHGFQLVLHLESYSNVLRTAIFRIISAMSFWILIQWHIQYYYFIPFQHYFNCPVYGIKSPIPSSNWFIWWLALCFTFLFPVAIPHYLFLVSCWFISSMPQAKVLRYTPNGVLNWYLNWSLYAITYLKNAVQTVYIIYLYQKDSQVIRQTIHFCQRW